MYTVKPILVSLLLAVVVFAAVFPHRGWPAERSLVLLPLTLYAEPDKAYLRPGIRSLLIPRLAGGGLLILDASRVRAELTTEERDGVTDPRRVEALARRLEADYAVYGSVTAVGEGYSLDLALMELRAGEPKVTRVSEAVAEDEFIPRMAEIGRRLRAVIEGRPPEPSVGQLAERAAEPEKAKGLFAAMGGGAQPTQQMEQGILFRPARARQSFNPTGQLRLGSLIVGFDVGDLDGDGVQELVFVDRKALSVYQAQGGVQALKGKQKAGVGEDFLRVSVGDVDNDGRDEIYLVSRYGSRARSTVLGWDGEFRRLDRMRGHVRVLKGPGRERPTLIFQQSKTGAFLGGPMYEMSLEDGELKRGAGLARLKEGQFYTLARRDLNGDGTPEWIGLGAESRLQVWDQEGDVLWSDRERLGGTNNFIKLGPWVRGDPPPNIYLNSRVAIMDVDGDGQEEILALKNIPLIGNVTELVVYRRSTLTAFRSDGANLAPAWTTGEMDWALADIQSAGGTLYLAAQKGRYLNVTSGSSQIMWFE